jgi:hypothetical protein
MALLLFQETVMMPKDGRPRTTPRAENPREPVREPAPDPAQAKRMLTHYVDPYDMQMEPPQEEPGYGHGV